MLKSSEVAGGFIPTRAGKILGLTSEVGNKLGSSPLARGKWHSGLSRKAETRFIPTRAGKINSKASYAGGC